MNVAQQQVFGVLREADEPWLEMWELAKRSSLGVWRCAAAVRDLRRAGVVVKRASEGQRVSKVEVSLAIGGVR